MRYLTLVLFLLVTPLPALCQGNVGCPWLNVATASGVLRSSDNSGTMAAMSQGSKEACTFLYHDATASRELRITTEEVQDPSQAMTSYKTHCSGEASPLPAIGNEAVMCAADVKGQAAGEQVIGRVRDQVFTVAISTSARNDPSMSGDDLKERTRNIAEQVAGALF
jgi:hypothetical protein